MVKIILFKKRKVRKLRDLLHIEIKLQGIDEQYDNILLYNYEEYALSKESAERTKQRHKKEHQEKIESIRERMNLLGDY